jgi:hypothetical protein
MATTIPDLWPANFGSDVELTPAAILKVQAAKLAERTNGMVVGEVKTRVEGETVFTNFNLVAPALNNYRYKLFYIAHDFSDYPLNLTWPSEGEPIKVTTSEEFLVKLGEFLHSERTARIINSLIQHSQE